MKRLAIGTIKFMFKVTCVVWIFACAISFCTDDFWYSAMCVHHDYGAWVKVNETTCTEDGIEERTCKICGQKSVREYKAYGHEYIAETTKEATVFEEGEIEYTCFRCGDSYTKSVPKLEATFTSSFVAPTGDDPSTGYVLYVCDQDPTYTYKEPLTFTATVVKPDCYNEGYTIYVCNEGDYSYISDYTAKTEHDWQLMSDHEATCEDSGGMTWICKNCNESKYEVFDPLGHDYITDESKSWDATCTEKGHISGSCRRCGKVLDEDIAPLGHEWSEWEVTKEPTFESEGLIVRTCSRDNNHKESKVLPAFNSLDYVEHIITEPTCTEEGRATYSYSLGSTNFVFSVTLEALGHDFGEWEIVSAPTLTEEGEIKAVCLNDPDHEITIVLPALSLDSEDYIV